MLYTEDFIIKDSDLAYNNQLLSEMFYDYYQGPSFTSRGKMLDFKVFKNPTKKEWYNKAAYNARIWIAPSGDIFVESYDFPCTNSEIIHSDLLKSVAKKGEYKMPRINDIHDFYANVELYFEIGAHIYGILAQRVEDEYEVEPSESIVLSVRNSEKIKNILTLASRNCDYLKFVDWDAK